MKRRLCMSLLLSICLLITLSGYAFAAGFSDLQGHWGEGQINKWAEKGLAGGYADGTFRPDAEVTRAEFVALVNRAFGINNQKVETPFTDVKISQWYYGDVATAKAAGYTGGYSDGTFRPGQTISRQEVASILARLVKLEPTTGGLEAFADAGQMQEWSKGSIGAVVNRGLMRGFPDNTFKPLKSITRAEAVVALDRALSANQFVGNSTIEGNVTFNGDTISNAVVKVFAADSYKVLNEIKTNDKGYFKLELGDGNYDLTVATAAEVGYKSDVIVEKNKTTSIALSLEKAAVLSGDLEDKDGRTVKNATIAFTTNPTFVTTTNKDGKFSVSVLPNRTYTVRAYNPDKKDQEPDVVTSTLEAGPAGNRLIKTLQAHFTVSNSISGGGSSGPSGPPDSTVVVEKDVTIGQPVAIGKLDKPTKVIATVKTTTGENIAMEIDIPATGKTCEITVNSVPVEVAVPPTDDVENPFVGLDIKITGAEGTVVKIALPVPTGLDPTQAGAYHYNPGTGIWEYRKATIVSGKVVFDTTLSPVAVSKKMGIPFGLKATKVTNNSIALTWNTVDKAKFYKIYRDNKYVGETNETSFVDNNNLASGYKYTYTVVAYNKYKFESEKSAGFSIASAPIAIPENNLMSILKGIEEVFSQMSQEDWENLRAKKDQLLGYTDDEIMEALKATGLAKPFEAVINSNITDDQARITLGIIRTMAYIGKDNVTESYSLISNKIAELKNLYEVEITKLLDKGVDQQAVYEYAVDLYDSILIGEYKISNNKYEEDLYNTALKVLCNGKHSSLESVAIESFNKVKEEYSKVYDSDSEFEKIIKIEIISKMSFELLTGNDICQVKKFLIAKVTDDNSKYQAAVDLMDLVLETSKIFIPIQD